MNMRQRAPNILKTWAILFGLLILLHATIAVGWVLLDPASTRSVGMIIALMIVYVIGLAVILFFFYRRVGRAFSPPENREAREQGIPATAKVLEVTRTRWHRDRYVNLSFKVRPRKWEYEIRLRVSRPGEADYEGMVAEFLSGSQVPQKGDVIPVKVHPQRPEVIVFVHEGTE